MANLVAQEEKEKDIAEQLVEKGEGERIETIGTKGMEIEEEIPFSPLYASLLRGARIFHSLRCSAKENISPSILRFVGTVTGTIIDIVTHAPMSTGGQIGQIKELVVNLLHKN